MLTIPKNCGSCLACEKATLVAIGALKTAVLRGFSEFGTPSAPPRYYRKYSVNGGWTWTRDLGGGSPVWTEAGSGSGLSPWSWSASTGELADAAGLSDSTRVDTNSGNMTHAPFTNYGLDVYNVLSDDPSVPSGAAYTPGNSYGDVVAGSGDEFPVVYSVESPTQATFTQSGGTASPDSISSGSFVYTLSDEDTEADALARADEEELFADEPDTPLNIVTIREDRADDSNAFTDLRTKLAIICRGLSDGHTYRATIEFDKRTAVGYGLYSAEGYDALYGEWEAGGSIVSDSFVADADKHVVGGTWSDANDDEEIQGTEVTPELDMPDDQGWQYRVSRVYLERLD